LLLTPTEIETAALDILSFWENSKLEDEDKIKILEMVKNYYEDKGEYLHELYLFKIAEGELDERSKNKKN
jgi:hypothetical protein